MRGQALAIGLVLATSVSVAAAQSSELGGATAPAPTAARSSPEADLSLTLCSNVHPPSANYAELPIYCGSAGDQRPFIGPYLKIDWSVLDTRAKDKCERQAGSLQVRVRVPFEFMSQQVLNEAKSELATDSKFRPNTGAQIQLYAHPYGSIVIFSAGVDGSGSHRIDRYSYPPDGMRLQGTGRLAQTNFHPINLPPFILDVSCDELREIVDDENLYGEIYFQYVTIERNVFTAHLQNFLHDSAYANIFNNQSQTGSVTVSTSGGSSGFGINIPGVSFGSSHNNGQVSTTDSRKRYVTENVLQEAAKKYTSSFSATYWTEFNQDSPSSKEDVAQQLVAALMKDAREDELAIELAGNSMTFLGPNDYKGQLAERDGMIIMNATPQGPFNAATDQSGSVGYGDVKVTGTDKRTLTIPSGPTIKYEKKDGSWVPTSISLYSITKADSVEDRSVSYTEARAKAGEGFAMRPLQTIDAKAIGTPPVTLPPRDAAVLPTGMLPPLPQFPTPQGITAADVEFCDPGYTLANVQDNAAMVALHANGPYATSTPGRVLWKVPPTVTRCQAGSPPGNCVVPYGVCSNLDHSIICAVNDLWLGSYFAQFHSPAVRPDIHVVCQ